MYIHVLRRRKQKVSFPVFSEFNRAFGYILGGQLT